MKIELSNAEALVLHDWPHKSSGKKELFDDLSEQYVLWNIDFQLERELAESASLRYAEAVAEARASVRKTC